MFESTSPHVRARFDGAILRIELARPDRENMLTYEMMEAVTSLVAEAGADPELRAIAISGEGPSFCAGDDPDDLGPWPDALRHRRPPGSHGPAPIIEQAMLRAVRSVPRPTVASLHGKTLGLGLDLASVCDLRVVALDAEIGDPRVHEARFAATGTTYVLPRLIGLSQAMRILLAGERIDGAEAARIGFAHVTCRADRVRAETDALLATFATAATRSYAVIKQQVLDELDLPYEAALMHSMAIRQTNVIEDRAEGGRAFREKRAPRYTGR